MEEKGIRAFWDEWSLVGVYNHEAGQKEFEFSIDDLTLPHFSRRYQVFDFWKEQYLGLFENKGRVNVPQQDSLLLCVRPARGHPQVLSTNMHYTQGAFEFNDLTWDAGAQVLCFSSEFACQVDVKIFIHVPEDYVLHDIKADGVEGFSVKQAGTILVVAYDNGRNAACKISFNLKNARNEIEFSNFLRK
jgi:hypothetical protein